MQKGLQKKYASLGDIYALTQGWYMSSFWSLFVREEGEKMQLLKESSREH